MAASGVPKLYRSVIEDVMTAVRDVFLDEGVDEQVLLELRQTWERKLLETKAIEHNTKETDKSNATGVNSGSSASGPNANPRSGSQRNSQQHREVAQAQPVMQQQVQQQAQGPAQVLGQGQAQGSGHGVIAGNAGRIAQGVPQGSQQVAPRLNSGGSPAITQQLTFPAGLQSMFQITGQDGGDGRRTVTLNSQQLALLQKMPQNQGLTLMSSPAAAATLALPSQLSQSLLQMQGQAFTLAQSQASVVQNSNQTSAVNSGVQYQAVAGGNIVQGRVPQNARSSQQSATNGPGTVVQLDGPNDSSDEEEDEEEFRDNDDDHDDNDDDQNDEENECPGEEEEPLNSEDDVSDEDPTELFETDNVVVCQYDKITRSRNKWKFHLKDGIMNLQGKDYVFQKAIGDAEW